MLLVVSCPILKQRVFDCYSGQHVLQTSLPLKTSGHRLLRDSNSIAAQPLRLIKQHEMTRPYIPSKPSSNRCLTKLVPF
ncbi:hypothetical protein TNCV_3153451 [Trichonephila clavipes]|nr:hypothetical protein TNCV_3153451 [Trichonephila clavipes]